MKRTNPKNYDYLRLFDLGDNCAQCDHSRLHEVDTRRLDKNKNVIGGYEAGIYCSKMQSCLDDFEVCKLYTRS